MVIKCASHRSSAASALMMPEFSNANVNLEGKFEYVDSIESMIGMGAFGAVFKGVDLKTKKSVAVKRMLRVNVKENELQQIRDFKCEYLVGVLDICAFDEITCCLIMELCDCDLDHHMRNISIEGVLNPHNFRQLLDNIARGYKALYEMKIVHRDIKPQNILISYMDASKQIACARITDFGIARTLGEEETELCNVAGTFFYMAPEVGANLLKTCQYDSKVDMWSIGCLLFQCVTGEVPFDECSLCKLFLYVAGDNFEAYDPPELPPETSVEVSSIIKDLLQLDSNKRCTPVQFHDRAVTWTKQIC
ncbi:unnamed protein product [Caenorhabditis bovis]|uniref:Protein kinase domain-containing protein n=1 Tax=Caenorhabditis bovis TaxID=2654633 RepID=A0A8S1FF91_9PELO|nr:unnamed protein product [Caenorhabditis bovis]